VISFVVTGAAYLPEMRSIGIYRRSLASSVTSALSGTIVRTHANTYTSISTQSELSGTFLWKYFHFTVDAPLLCASDLSQATRRSHAGHC